MIGALRRLAMYGVWNLKRFNLVLRSGTEWSGAQATPRLHLIVTDKTVR
jgi:hypothetical protein